MSRRPPLLIALQTEATVLMCLALGQAGLAAGYLDGHENLKVVHGTNGLLIAAVTVALLITAFLYRGRQGPRWPMIGALILLAAEVVQIIAGISEVKGAHIFGGVIFTVLAVLMTSYLFRPGFTPQTGPE